MYTQVWADGGEPDECGISSLMDSASVVGQTTEKTLVDNELLSLIFVPTVAKRGCLYLTPTSAGGGLHIACSVCMSVSAIHCFRALCAGSVFGLKIRFLFALFCSDAPLLAPC